MSHLSVKLPEFTDEELDRAFRAATCMPTSDHWIDESDAIRGADRCAYLARELIPVLLRSGPFLDFATGFALGAEEDIGVVVSLFLTGVSAGYALARPENIIVEGSDDSPKYVA